MHLSFPLTMKHMTPQSLVPHVPFTTPKDNQSNSFQSYCAWSLVLSGLEGTLQSNNCGDGGVRAVHEALYHHRELRNPNVVVEEDLRLHVRLRIRVVLVRLVLRIVVAFDEVFLRIGVFVVVLLLLVLLVVSADLRISLALPPSGSVLCQKQKSNEKRN